MQGPPLTTPYHWSSFFVSLLILTTIRKSRPSELLNATWFCIVTCLNIQLFRNIGHDNRAKHFVLTFRSFRHETCTMLRSRHMCKFCAALLHWQCGRRPGLRNAKQTVWNATNNYFSHIQRKILCSNTLYYWQNILFVPYINRCTVWYWGKCCPLGHF